MQAVITKYIGPTNTRGARIKIDSWYGSKTYPYDYNSNEAHDVAFGEWLEDINAKMRLEHPDSQLAQEGQWFKKVSRGAHPSGTGYVFIIK